MDWRFSTFLLFLFALLTGITWATSQDGLCHSTYVLDVLAQQNKDGALNCFDFWFNRYQTFIAALIALGTALIALRPAFSQMQEMQRQTNQKRYDSMQTRLTDVVKAQEAVSSLQIKASIIAMTLRDLLAAKLPIERKIATDNIVTLEAEFKADMQIKLQFIRGFLDAPVDYAKRSEFINDVYEFALKVGEFYVPIATAYNDVAGDGLREAVFGSRKAIEQGVLAAEVLVASAEAYYEPLMRENAKIRAQLALMKSTI